MGLTTTSLHEVEDLAGSGDERLQQEVGDARQFVGAGVAEEGLRGGSDMNTSERYEYPYSNLVKYVILRAALSETGGGHARHDQISNVHRRNGEYGPKAYGRPEP